MVPDGWKNTHLIELIEGQIKNGYSPNATDHITGYWVLGLGALGEDGFNDEAIKPVEPTEKVLGNLLACNDFLVSRSNTPDKVGRAVRYKGDLSNCSYPDLMMRFRIDPKKADLDYVEQKIRSSSTRNYYKSRAAGSSSTMVKINKSVVEQTPIQLPPLSEQKKISKILSAWDRAIEITEKLISNSQQQKKSLMQQLLTGKKRLKGFSGDGFTIRKGFAKSKLGEIPDSWQVKLIEKYFWYQEGPGVRKHQFTENGVKLFNGTNIQNSQVNLSNTKTCISENEANGSYAHFLADSGDLVIACSGISVDRFDEKIAFLNESHLPLCMNTSTMRFKTLSSELADIDYFKYFMMSPSFKNQIRRQITGSAQLNFGPSHVGKCYVILPTIEEQQKVASVLSTADREIETLQQKLTCLKQEKKALMQQLLTGKRRIKIDGDELPQKETVNAR